MKKCDFPIKNSRYSSDFCPPAASFCGEVWLEVERVMGKCWGSVEMGIFVMCLNVPFHQKLNWYKEIYHRRSGSWAIRSSFLISDSLNGPVTYQRTRYQRKLRSLELSCRSSGFGLGVRDPWGWDRWRWNLEPLEVLLVDDVLNGIAGLP